MKNGYKIRWTPNALKELTETIKYLKSNFTGKVVTRLALRIEDIVKLISQNPELFQECT